jgi:hypothetical protein
MRAIKSRTSKAVGIAVVAVAICGSVVLGAQGASAAQGTSATVRTSVSTNTVPAPAATPAATSTPNNDPWD